MPTTIRKAQRRAVPMLISIASVSGGGKTFSALLMAAGLAGPNGRVGMIDTENGRGEMYADSAEIMQALPNGYEYLGIDAPFSPDHYIEAIKIMEDAGITVCVVDSMTHEWEGIGGCCEIAEPPGGKKNWARAKIAHKKLVYHCLSSPMHIIFCIRARDKVKIEKQGGKDVYIPLGLQAVTEKNFQFEMLLSLRLDEISHFATPIKCPSPLVHLFSGQRLISKADGASITEWNNGGRALDPLENMIKRARATAESGIEAYEQFFMQLSPAQRKALVDAGAHGENKEAALEADRYREGAENATEDITEPVAL